MCMFARTDTFWNKNGCLLQEEKLEIIQADQRPEKTIKRLVVKNFCAFRVPKLAKFRKKLLFQMVE